MVVPKRAVKHFAQAASKGRARGFALGGFQLFIYCRLLNISCGRSAAAAAEERSEEVSYLCVGVPAHRPRVSHLPVLDKLGAGA